MAYKFKDKTLLDLGKALKIAFEQQNRAKTIRKLALKKIHPFAKVLIYENLIVFQIGTIFEKINLLHLFSLFKTTKKTPHYFLPNFTHLMDSYTLGAVLKLTESVFSSHPGLLRNLKKFNSSRTRITHKMFDLDKIPSEAELIRTAKDLVVLGDRISEDLSNIAQQIDETREKLERV